MRGYWQSVFKCGDLLETFPSYTLRLSYAWYQKMVREHGPGTWAATRVK